MKKFIVIFLICIFLESVLTLSGMVIANLGVYIFAHTFKIVFALVFITLFLFHLKVRVIKFNNISKLFLIYLVFSALYGLYTNGFSKEYTSHLYGHISPIIGISFGIYFWKNYTQNIENLLSHIMKYAFILQSIIIVNYFVLYKLGYIVYFGISSTIAFFVAYYLSRNNYRYVLFAILLTFLTGKRAVLVTELVIIVLYIYFYKRNSVKSYIQKVNGIVIKILLSSVLLLSVYFVYKIGLLDRFKAVFEIDFSDSHSVYLATGGRSEEFSYLFEHFNKSPIIYLIGGGFGEKFNLPADPWTRHYSHFSPFSFVLLYGVPFTLYYYFYLFKIFRKGFRRCNNFFYLVFVILFVTSFAGSINFDPFFYIFLGISYCVISDKNLNYC